MQPCKLYGSKKPLEMRLFVAAAALYWLTGKAEYRTAADQYFANTNKDLYTGNWDNTVIQACSLLAVLFVWRHACRVCGGAGGVRAGGTCLSSQ